MVPWPGPGGEIDDQLRLLLGIVRVHAKQQAGRERGKDVEDNVSILNTKAKTNIDTSYLLLGHPKVFSSLVEERRFLVTASQALNDSTRAPTSKKNRPRFAGQEYCGPHGGIVTVIIMTGTNFEAPFGFKAGVVACAKGASIFALGKKGSKMKL